jgi:prevent-host-death family protein
VLATLLWVIYNFNFHSHLHNVRFNVQLLSVLEKSTMQTLTASEARSNLYRLMDETAASHQPITISGKRNNAVLVSAEDWSAIQETLFLLSVPNMRESIKQGMDEPIEECSQVLDW